MLQDKARKTDLWDLIQGWGSLVSQCEDGYQFSIFEYDNDVTVRNKIEEVSKDKPEDGASNYTELREALETLDNRLRKIMILDVRQPNSSGFWWNTGVLKYAGEEYASDIKSRYNIEIEVHSI